MQIGVKLTLYLVGAVMGTMSIFAYFSIRADSANFLKELSQGMKGFAQAIGETLSDTYGNERDLEATQELLDAIGPLNSIHSLVVFDSSGQVIATSPSFAKHAVKGISTQKVLETGEDQVGYVESGGTLAYYRMEAILDTLANPIGAFLLIRQGTELSQDLIDRRNRIIGTTSALIVVLVILILFFVNRNVSRPIAELIRRIGGIGRTAEVGRVRKARENEIATLEREFNLMSDRLGVMNSRLHYTEKLVLVAQLSAGLAHEIATPLGVIGGRAENLLRRDRSPGEVRENLQIIQAQIDRIVRVVQRQLDFSRPKQSGFRAVDILGIIDEVKTLLEHRLVQRGARVTVSAGDSVPLVLGDPDQLQQVFINLFLNALDAVDSTGVLKVRVECAGPSGEPASGNGSCQVRIIFEDNGKGIEATDIEHIFDPFFSTKEPGFGTGLGLFITSDIVRAHGGTIDVVSELGRFTRFTVLLPAVERHATDREVHS